MYISSQTATTKRLENLAEVSKQRLPATEHVVTGNRTNYVKSSDENITSVPNPRLQAGNFEPGEMSNGNAKKGSDLNSQKLCNGEHDPKGSVAQMPVRDAELTGREIGRSQFFVEKDKNKNGNSCTDVSTDKCSNKNIGSDSTNGDGDKAKVKKHVRIYDVKEVISNGNHGDIRKDNPIVVESRVRLPESNARSYLENKPAVIAWTTNPVENPQQGNIPIISEEKISLSSKTYKVLNEEAQQDLAEKISVDKEATEPENTKTAIKPSLSKADDATETQVNFFSISTCT